MSSEDPTAVVGVLRLHLLEIYAALDWAKGYFSAMDLADQYRSGAPVPRTSRSTALLTKASNHVGGYLEATEEASDGE